VPAVRLHPLSSGSGAEILTWLDDHSRYALPVTAHARVAGGCSVIGVRDAAGYADSEHPASAVRSYWAVMEKWA
jgi:hypothetical protein